MLQIFKRILSTWGMLCICFSLFAQFNFQDSLQLYHPLDGNAGDSSGNGLHGTIFGGPTATSDRFGNAGSAFAFDGNDDYITSTDTFDYEIRTIVFWLNASQITALQVAYDIDNNALTYGNTHVYGNNGNLYGNAGGDNNSGNGALLSSTVQTNQWYHIAVQRNQNNTYGYFNGKLVYTGTASSNSSASGSPLRIATNRVGAYDFNGSLDDFRIYNRQLSESEIEFLYCPTSIAININDTTIDFNTTVTLSADSANADSIAWYINGSYLNSDSSFNYVFDSAGVHEIVLFATDGFCEKYDTSYVFVEANSCLPPGALQDSMKLHYPFYGNSNDFSPSDYHGTIHGATLTNDRFGTPNSAFNFDGINDYIEYVNPSANLDYQFRTISLWLKADNLSGSTRPLEMDHVGLNYGSFGLIVLNNMLTANPGGNGGVILTSQMSSGLWYHVVIQRDATNTYGYVNGSLVHTGTASGGGSISSPNYNFILGCSRVYSQFYDGVIDDVRVYNRVLTNTEIKTLYCPSQANIEESDTLIYSGITRTFNAECSKYPLSWVLNGDTLSNDSSFTYAFNSEGLYEIILVSTDGYCIDYDTARVHYLPDSTCLGTDTIMKVSSTIGGFSGVLDNGDLFGSSLTRYPDINNDQIDEIIVSAPKDDDGGTDRGALYMISMNNQGVIYEHHKISNDSGNLGIGLANNDLFGASVDVAGDINGDGFADIVVGASYTDDGGLNRGAVWVLFMDSAGMVISKQKISDTQGGLQESLDNWDRFGSAVSSIGDLNGDGVPDLACGISWDDNGGGSDGSALILFLNSNGTVSSEVKLNKLTSGLESLLNNGDRFGDAIELLGDLDGDGFQEIAIGAGGFDAGGNDRGAVIIASINASGGIENAFRITQNENGFNESLDNIGSFGVALDNLGDIDGDGYIEVAVGNWRDNTGALESGAVWILSLDSSGYVFNTIKIDNNLPGLNLAFHDRFGLGLSSVGDINNDGVTDLAVGALEDDDGGTDRGAFYIFSMIDTCCPLVAQFSTPTNVLCPDESLAFTNTSANTNAGATYQWFVNDSVVSTNQNLNYTFNDAGNYYVVLTVNDSCTRSYGEIITVHPEPFADAGSSQFLCTGDSAQLSASGGTSYQWSNGATLTNDTIADPIAFPTSTTIYQLTVTNSFGCTDDDNIAIIVNPVPTVEVSGDTIICANTSTTLTATGALTYTWTPSTYLNSSTGNPVVATPSQPITYVVKGTDANGCTDTSEIKIQLDTSLVATIASSNNVSCYNGSDGSATANITGGSSPYSYLWTNGSTSISANSLSAGIHLFSVTDSEGCVDTVTLMIDQPDSISISAIIAPVSCNGLNDGSISTTITGGTAPYSYLWNTTATGTNINGLIADNYTITVTDDNNCTKSAVFNVPEPSSLIATISASTNVLCNGGSSGTATATGSGGTSPYSFLWNNGSSSNSVSNLSAGTNTVTITDFNGCSDTAQVFIAEPFLALTASITSISNVSCNGGNNGSISVSGNGGTPPFSFLWSTNATSASITSLSAGVYTVTVTDDNGCSDISTASVTEPTALGLSFNVDTNVSCNGGSDGVATVSPSGGTSPYAYAWAAGSNSQTQNSLIAGTHLVTVTDNNNCQIVGSVTIIEPALLDASTTVTNNVSCNGLSDGATITSATGGTTPYSYAWSSGGNTNAESGLSAGSYTVTITDANGCSDTSQVTITEPTDLVVSIDSAFDALCFGGNSGHAYASAGGGTSPYNFNWSSGSTNSSASGLNAGIYTVTVTDANNCTDTAIVTIDQATALIANLTQTSPVVCNGDSNGVASSIVSGGTPGYSYLWENGEITSTATMLWAGSQNLTVTDANGCSSTSSVVVTEPAILTTVLDSTKDVICNGFFDGAAYTSGIGGVGGYSFAWNSGALVDDIENLTSGIYILTLTDGNGCTDTTSVEIIELDPILPNVSHNDVTCFDGADGSTSSALSGGGTSFAYQWSNSAISTGLSNLSAGVYTLTITDENNCSGVDSAIVVQPDSIEINITVNPITCFGFADGSASFSTIGGTAPYSYLWSNGAVDTIDAGLDQGDYFITITDNFGCTNVDSFEVSEPTQISVFTALIDSVSCFGLADGKGIAAGSGGVGDYSFVWNDGTLTDTLTNVQSGTYTVTIQDTNGCSAQSQIDIPEPALLMLSLDSILHVQCYDSANGVLGVGYSGGNGNVTYSWSNNGTTALISGLDSGSYSITVSDIKGCSDSATYQLNQPDTSVHIANSIITDAYCLGGAVGGISVSGDGGTGPYTIDWSNNGSGTSIMQLNAGTYSLTITDALGCEHDSNFTVLEPLQPDTATTTSSDITCYGDSNGIISAQFVGGIAPFDYSWSNFETSQLIDNLASGIYSVTITDDVGCIQVAVDSIAEPDTLIVLTTISDSIECFGTAIGELVASATGGTHPYSFLWSNNFTSDTISLLESGTYSVTLTDNNGCTDSSSIYLSQPEQIQLDSNILKNVSCNGYDDGNMELYFSGGTGPFGYAWSNGDTTAILSLLAPGTYYLTVTDANLCSIDTAFEITQPDSLLPQTGLMDSALCNNTSDGSVYAFAQGGTLPYSFFWSTNTNTDTLAGIGSGMYSVTVTDDNGCVDSTDIYVPFKFQQPSIGLDSSALFCDTTSGYISANPGYSQYHWSTGEMQHTLEVDSTGIYNITVTSFQGCVSSDSISVSFAQSTSFSLGKDTVICVDEDLFAYSIIPSPSSLESYVWSTGDTTSVLTVNVTGIYQLTATNASGCSSENHVLVVFDTCRNISIEKTISDISLSIYPNPTRNWINIVRSNNNPEEMELVMRSAQGNLVERKKSKEQIVRFDLSNQAAGIYIISVTSNSFNSQFRIIKQ